MSLQGIELKRCPSRELSGLIDKDLSRAQAPITITNVLSRASQNSNQPTSPQPYLPHKVNPPVLTAKPLQKVKRLLSSFFAPKTSSNSLRSAPNSRSAIQQLARLFARLRMPQQGPRLLSSSMLYTRPLPLSLVVPQRFVMALLYRQRFEKL